MHPGPPPPGIPLQTLLGLEVAGSMTPLLPSAAMVVLGIDVSKSAGVVSFRLGVAGSGWTGRWASLNR